MGSDGFSGRFMGSPIIILHAPPQATFLANFQASPRQSEGGPSSDLILHNPVRLGAEGYYPDIILGHGFREEAFSPQAGSFPSILYAQLIPLLAPHQLLSFSLNLALERRRLYPLINAVKNYALALDNLHFEDRNSAPPTAPLRAAL